MTDWSISGSVPPKFWLGNRVRFKCVPRYIGIVYGIEWRSRDLGYGPPHGGWWYRVRWDGKDSLMGMSEDSLEILK